MEDIPLYIGKRKNILVISGGGIKGLSALGVLTRLKELGIIDKPEIYCGTSVGSVISILLLIGYSAEDIYDMLLEIDFSTLMINNIENILEDVHIGLNLIDPIVYIVAHLMKKKDISKKITFIELFNKFNSKLIITGTCINDTSLHYFSHETYPNMKVIDAIKISISIPLLFKPHFYNNKVWIDGGCMNNYPIDIFNDKLNDVIGIYLDEEYNNYDVFDDVQIYIQQVMKSILKGLTYYKIEAYKDYTIHIKCSSINTWDIQRSDKINMYEYGYNLTKSKFG